MVVSYKTFLGLACNEALAGLTNQLASPILDVELIAETLVPEVFQAVALSYAADPQKASLLNRDNTITLADGVGDLPAVVLTECKFNGTVYDPDDDTVAPTMSLVRTWFDFITPSSLDRLTGRWTIKDAQIYWIEAGATYSSTSGKSGDIVLNIPSVPEIPDSENDDMEVADEALSDLITALAQRLRGKLEVAA